MSMMSVHADALEAGGALYHEFLLRFRKQHKVVYGIVEGKDDPLFYRGLIEQHLPSGWDVDFLVAGNKNKVLRAEEDFDWERFSRSRICFFVDRDLSEFSDVNGKRLKNLYITDNYSIENELANFATVKRVIQEILNVTDVSHGEFLLMRRSFDENIRMFSGSMASIMAQIIIWQKEGARPSLDNIVPRDLFEFKNGSLKLKDDFDSVASRISYVARKVNLRSSSEAEISAATEYFRSKSGVERFIRGKYISWFFVEQCLHFHARIQDYCKAYTVPPKVRVTLGQANAIALVANRIRCPESLEEFIKLNYCEYIQGPKENSSIGDIVENEPGIWRRVIDATSGIFDRWFPRRAYRKP